MRHRALDMMEVRTVQPMPEQEPDHSIKFTPSPLVAAQSNARRHGRESTQAKRMASLGSSAMTPSNRKAGQRRLVDMSTTVDDAWYPDLPPVEEVTDTLPISETTSYLLKYGLDQYGRVTHWAVIQRRKTELGTHNVAVYDACHGKDVHVHLYDQHSNEIDQHPLHRRVRSYAELEDGLDYATERVVKDWQENERRSDRGK